MQSVKRDGNARNQDSVALNLAKSAHSGLGSDNNWVDMCEGRVGICQFVDLINS